MKHLLLFLFLIFAVCVNAFSADYGFLLSGHCTAEENIYGRASFSSWCSIPFDNSDFFISAGLNTDFSDEVSFIPELIRMEYSTRLFNSVSIRAGRIPWMDTSRFTAKGRFDGAEILFDYNKIRFGASCFYTGLLYKETANINNSKSISENESAFDWSDFSNTYFAPKRLLTSIYGEFPGFPFQRGNFYAGLLAHFDLDNSEYFSTQYLLLRYTFTYKQFDFLAAGAAELESTNSNGIRPAFAYSLETGMQLPTPIRDRVSLGFRWSSGEGQYTAAFYPIISEAQGIVLKPGFSGMMIINANYEARIHSSFSSEIGARYFIRTDSSSFIDNELENDFYSIGAEVHGQLLWVPVSDLFMSLTGGIFLPQTGRAMHSDAKPRLFLRVGTLLSF